MRPVRYVLMITIVGILMLAWAGTGVAQPQVHDSSGASLTARSRTSIVFRGTVMPQFVKSRSVGASWPVGLAQTIGDAQAHPHHVYVVWQDWGGTVRFLEYDVRGPFGLDLQNADWVQDTWTLENGSVVVATACRELDVFVEVAAPFHAGMP